MITKSYRTCKTSFNMTVDALLGATGLRGALVLSLIEPKVVDFAGVENDKGNDCMRRCEGNAWLVWSGNTAMFSLEIMGVAKGLKAGMDF